MIIVDTNVIPELLRPVPAERVETWLSVQDGASVYFTTTGEAELRHRVAILPFDRPAARAYAAIAAERRALGRPISQFYCQIAAIARAHGAGVATRNISDYESCGIELVNPWVASR